MAMRRTVVGGCGILGLMVVAAGMMGEERQEGEDAERLKAQREQVVKLAAPIFERIDAYDKLTEREAELGLECARAETDAEQAKKTLEVQQIAVKEYEEGTYPTDLQTAKGEITLAESELARAKDRLEGSNKRLKNRDDLDLQNEADKLAVDKAEYTLEQAKRKLKVLTDFTRAKEVSRLKAAVVEANIDANDKQAKYDRLKGQPEEMKRELAKDPAPNRSEMMILFHVNLAIQLQDDNKLDEAQKKLDEAEQTARELEAKRAEQRFLATRERMKDLFEKAKRNFPGGFSKPQ